MLEITVDGKNYKFDQGRLMNTEVKQMQRLFGISIRDFSSFDLSNIDVVDALVWLVKTREGEQVDPENLEYNLAGIDVRDLDDPGEADAVDPSEPSPSGESPKIPDES